MNNEKIPLYRVFNEPGRSVIIPTYNPTLKASTYLELRYHGWGSLQHSFEDVNMYVRIYRLDKRTCPKHMKHLIEDNLELLETEIRDKFHRITLNETF